MNPPPNSDLVDALLKVGGRRNGRCINIFGPGHSKNDHSLGVWLDPKAPYGFRVHSLAGDDPALCRKHVLRLLAKAAAGGAVEIELEEKSANHPERLKRTAFALSIWEGALPVADTPAAVYLASRKCKPSDFEPWPTDLRFHPACPFASFKFPGLIALIRNPISGEAAGIHRTAIRDDGSGKRTMPDGIPSKMTLGRSKSAAVMLYPPGPELGLAEGIETALSAHQIFKTPVSAAMSAIGIHNFPVIPNITFRRILRTTTPPEYRLLARASADTKRRASKWKFDTRQNHKQTGTTTT